MIKLQTNPQRSYFVKFNGPPIYDKHREENQQVGNVGQQYVKPFIIEK